jgi:excisionase family DNA binding protein
MENPFELINARLSNIETLLIEIKCDMLTKTNVSFPEPEQWFDLSELCQYHPDKPSRATVYGWVSMGIIPVHKGGKKLRFLKSEIDNWLKGDDSLTNVSKLKKQVKEDYEKLLNS